MLITNLTPYVLQELEKKTTLVWGYTQNKPTDYINVGKGDKLLGVQNKRLKWYCKSQEQHLINRGDTILTNDDFILEILKNGTFRKE